MKTFCSLVRLFVLRNLRTEKFLSCLSILGIALGIGLFVGIKVSSDRAIASFEADIRGVNPEVNHEILSASGTDFDERVYPSIRRLAGKSYPVLKASAYLPEKKEVLELSGVYTLKAAGHLKFSGGGGFDFEEYFRTLNGVLVTSRFAQALGLKKGDTLTASVYDRTCELRIVGFLDTDSLPRNTAVMDLGNFQEYFGKTGSLTRIELFASEQAAAEISKTLPPGVVLEKKEQLISNQKALINSFRYNLQFVSLIAIMVGIFLLYNTVFISVIKRRTEIGILRALGTGKRHIVLLFLVQGLLFGVIGSVLGIVLGQIVAFFAVGAVEKTLSTMYATVSVSEYLISKTDAGGALLLGVLVSLVASVIPAIESSRIAPNESAKEGTFEGKYRGYYPLLSAIGLSAIAAGCLLAYVDYREMPFDFPFLAYAGILFIILGFSFVSPFYLSKVLKGIAVPSRKIFAATGQITIGDMRGNLYRFSVALMSVAISGALIIALLTLIFSFRGSLREWIRKNISADLYVKPASCVSNFCFFPLSGELIERINSFPEVAAVDKFRTLSIDFRGKKIIAGFGDVGLRNGQLRQRQRESYGEERRSELAKEKKVEMSNYLSVKYGLKRGDEIELQTPKGPQKFIVNDTFSSYSTTSGFMYLDRRWLREFWGLDDATQLGVYLRRDADPDRVIAKLKESLLPAYSLVIMNNRELREDVIRIFDKTFAITYAIELISIMVSLIGVVNTLLALVLEKKREISILRYLGGTWAQVRAILVLAAGIVGVTGIVLGGAMGLLMSVIFIHVINKISFGWEIHFLLPAGYLSIVALLLLLTTIGAGLIPSRVARKIDPKRFISFE